MQEKRKKRKILEHICTADKLRFAISAAVVVMAALIFMGCAKTIQRETQTGDPTETKIINGITADPIVTEYSGTPHGIIISGTEKNDKITYSTDGTVWSELAPSFIAPGVYIVYFKVERDGFKPHTGSSSVTVMRTELKDVCAEHVTVIYDGKEHGIKINGIADGDRVVYGNGEEKAPRYSEVGEYEVEFSVERAGAVHNGVAKLTVLPDLTGLYVSRNDIVRINKEKAVIGGKTFDLEYKVTGDGTVGGQPFSVKDGTLRYNGKDYILAAGKNVYKLIVGTDTVYVTGVGELHVSAEFGDGATVKADGETVFEVSGVNYCESVEGVIPKFDNNRAESIVTATGEITEAEIVFSYRQKLVIPERTEVVIFDGQAHEPTTEYGSPTKGSAQTETGEYSFEYFVIRDGYLPTVAVVKLSIVPDISGLYYDGNGFIEIKYDAASVNGRAVEFTPHADGWTIGGIEYSAQSDSITDESGRSYTKCKTEKIIALCSGDGIAVVADFVGGDYALEYESGQAILWLLAADGKQEKARINSDGNAFFMLDGRELYITADGFCILSAFNMESNLTVVLCRLSES